MCRWQARGSSLTADLLIVATVLVMGLVEAALASPALATRWQQGLLTLIYAGALLWRRRWPVPVLAVVIVLGPLLVTVNARGGILSYVGAALVASYTAGRRLDPPATWWGPALTVGFEWMVFAVTHGELSDYVYVALLYGGAWAVGYALRLREKKIAELAGEAQRLRDQQATQAALAVAQERTRIAREMHDVVSHSISVITIQTQAVRRRLDPAQTRDVQDLLAVETTARQAMAEMRRMLGVLRADTDRELDLAPQPGLSQLPQLVAETVAAGLPVQFQLHGEPTPLPPGVDLTAYRVVQEALTNVRRHTPGARTVVTVSHTASAVEICVDNEAAGSSAGSIADPIGEQRPGRGLTGIAERVTLYDGILDIGPRPEGGFRVRAILPIAEPLTSVETKRV